MAKRAPATLREYAQSATLEKHVREGIIAAFQHHGWRAYRIEPVRGVVDHGPSKNGKERKGFLKMNSSGDPDIIAVRCRLNMLTEIGAAYKGPHQHLPADVIFVECKRPKGGSVSKTQTAMHAVLRREGHTVIVATAWAEVVSEARKYGLEVNA